MSKTTAEPEQSVMGFRDKEKAEDTLKVLDGRDISYQYNVITAFVRRAKRVLEITKDEEKIAKIKDAVEVFNGWLDDYKKKGRSKENFAYLPLTTIEAYKALAKKYQLVEEDFLISYKEQKGDYKNLRDVKTPDGKATWDIERNRKLKEIVKNIKSKYIPWFNLDDGPLRGLPTEEHVKCIMLGYSPEPTKIKKLIPQITEKLKKISSSKDTSCNEQEKSMKTTKRSRSESQSDDTSSDDDNGEKNKKKMKKKI